MAGLKDYQISVYVANLGKYVEGVLQGAWITLPMPAERLQDTLKTEVGLGGRYEEYAIHDYDGGEARCRHLVHGTRAGVRPLGSAEYDRYGRFRPFQVRKGRTRWP